jgi:hypothetical protein
MKGIQKYYAVAVYDSTTNVPGHEMGIYQAGDYSWIKDSLNGGFGAEFNLTLEQAQKVKADFEQTIDRLKLEWASVTIEEAEIPAEDRKEGHHES